MDYQFTIYSFIFLVTSLVSFFVAFFAWQRRPVKGAGELTLMMIGAGFWSFWVIFETAATTLSGKLFWSELEYTAAVFTLDCLFDSGASFYGER